MKTTIQSALALASILTLSATHALADDSRSQWMQKEVQKLQRIESQLGSQDLQALDYYLGGIDALLERYHPSLPSFVCLSNGERGSFEKFTVTDPSTGTALGGATSLETCRQNVAGMNQNLICLSNGEFGSFEKFTSYDLGQKKNLGGATSLATCQAIVAKATPTLTCISNGEFGSFENFTLYNRSLQRTLGGGTQLKQCLDNLGR
jgi:hypothetical protein